jgi:protein TonB
MEFVFRKQSPASSALRFSVVVGLHVILVGGLMAGLGHSGMRIMPPPAIEYIKIFDTPPPPAAKPESHKVRAPSNVQVPLPEVPVVLPQALEPTMAAAPVDAVISTEASSSAITDGAGSTPSLAVSAACPNSQSVRNAVRYPLVARRDGIEGDVVARFVVGAAGGIRGAEIVSSSNRVFITVVLAAVQQFQCAGQGHDVMVEVPFSFRLQ